MDTKKLQDSLTALAGKIVQEASVIQNKGSIQKVTYQRIPAKKIDYQSNAVQYNFAEGKQFDIWKWQSSDFEAFFKNEVPLSLEYKSAVTAYTSSFGYPLEGATIAMHTFCRHFIDRASEGTYSVTNTERYIAAFIKECSTPFKRLSWTIELWLGNVHMESDEVEISSNVFLRRATLKQLDQIVQSTHYFEELERVTSHVVPATVLLSFPVQTEWNIAFGANDPLIAFEIEQWLNVLRLFKPSSLQVTRQVNIQQSLFGFQRLQAKGSPKENFLEGKIKSEDFGMQIFVLTKNEEASFKSFASRVKTALKRISPTAYLSGNTLDLAIHRYTDALIRSEVIAYKMLSSITSFESLLNSGGAEIIFRISSRVAVLLSYYDLKGREVMAKMKKAYSVRSTLVHGSSLGKNIEFANQNWKEIINYNRICILTFLLLQDQISAKDLIALIDDAMVDESSRIKLADLIQPLSTLIYNPAK